MNPRPLSNRLVRLALLVAASVLLAEITLQVAALCSRQAASVLAAPWERNRLVPDPHLGYRGNPLGDGHDVRGYRNSHVPEAAEIIVLGDSQSYGTGVSREAAWSVLVSQSLNLEVYNMALNRGCATGRQLLQLDEALSFQPSLVILGFYFGNDLLENFQLAAERPEIASLAAEELLEEALARQSSEAEAISGRSIFEGDPAGTEKSERRSILRLASRYSDLYGLARALRHFLDPPVRPALLSGDFESAAAAIPPEYREFVSVFDDGDWRTLLTSRYRGLVLDQTDPRIQLGYDITVSGMAVMQDRLREMQVGLLVILLPTKEQVFAPRVLRPEEHLGLEELVDNETALAAGLESRLHEMGIPVLNTTERLRAAPLQPYHEDADGHPNEQGHRIIADVVSAWIGEESVLADLPNRDS